MYFMMNNSSLFNQNNALFFNIAACRQNGLNT